MSLMAADQDLTSLSARLLEHVGCALRQLQPSLLLVQGDTITATAAAMAGFLQNIPVGHVEAGLRTYLPKDPYPEEVQRTAVTALATLHFAPTQYAADVLLQSGVCSSKIAVVGNTVVDSLLSVLGAGPSAATAQLLAQLGLTAPDVAAVKEQLLQGSRPDASKALMPASAALRWIIVTMHRRENFGQPVKEMVAAVSKLAAAFPSLRFLLPVHPNPNVREVVKAGLAGVSSVKVVEPLPYDQFVFALATADAVLTDSGGLQEESVALGKRLFVMRQTTERPEAIDSGMVTLVGARESSIVAQLGTWAHRSGVPSTAWPPAGLAAEELAAAQTAEEPHPVSAWIDPSTARKQRPSMRLLFGDGNAGARIAKASAGFVQALAATPAADRAAAVRDFQSCGHATFSAQALLTDKPDADHTIHDFTWHGGLPTDSQTFLAGHQRHRQRVECSAQPATHRMVYRKYEEVLAMDSWFAPDTNITSDAFAVTAIVSVFRRPQFFLRFLWAMGNQTHPPREVWVTTFASKHEDEFRAMVREHDRTGAVYKFIAGDANFKYFGRFALASMAKTPYVVLFDDDCIPGQKIVKTLLHMINVKNGDYNGLLGMKGHAQTPEDVNSDQHVLQPYWAQWNYRPADTWQVDLTGGVWFLRTEWVRQMWRETPSPIRAGPWGPWETGEDFHITYSLRKFVNVNTYLFPTDWGRGETWGASQDYFEMSSAGDTTVDNSLELRSFILYANILKGYTPARVDTMWGEAWNRTNVAALLPSVEAARAIAPVVQFLRTYFHRSIRVLPIVALDPRAPGVSPGGDGSPPTVTREQVFAAVGITFKFEEKRLGVFDLDLKKLSSRMRWRPTDLQVETEVALGGVFETVRPAAFILPYDEASPIVTAAAMTASVLRIPTIGYTAPSQARAVAGAAAGAGDALAEAIRDASAVGSADPDCIPVPPPQSLIDASTPHPAPIFGPLPETPVALCAVRQSVAYSRGLVNFITNSQVLAVRQLFDTLCSCERSVSDGDGTFTRCPDLGTELVLTEFSGHPARRL